MQKVKEKQSSKTWGFMLKNSIVVKVKNLLFRAFLRNKP